MARDWHELFKTWSKPPSDTEEAKGKHAADMIRDAIRSAPALKDLNIDVVATGSYRNNTNVRMGSDIDVAVVLRDTVWSVLNDGITRDEVGLRDVKYGFIEFRSDVHSALVAKFGNDTVHPQNKTFEIRESSTRLNADATPFLQHRRYSRRKDGSITTTATIVVEPDKRISVINVYRNNPRLELQTRSRPHRGTLEVMVEGAEGDRLIGEYWTDRKSTGRVALQRVSREQAKDWEHAQALAEAART